MLVRTDKVKRIIEFIDKMGIVDSTQVSRVFFPGYKGNTYDAANKLMQLWKYKFLKRRKAFLSTRYIYYYKKFPSQSQFEHKYYTTEFYTRICEKYGVKNCTCKCEYTGIEGIRPDAYITVKSNGYKYLFFVEVHISNNDFNYEKYREVQSKRKHIRLTQDADIFPYVIAITNSKIELDPHIDFVKIDTEFKEFDKVMQGIVE